MSLATNLDVKPSRRTMALPVLSREEFLDMFGKDYQNGQHVTALGPTQRGKTTAVQQMLARVISPERKVLILAGKPPMRDHTMTSAAERLNLRIVEHWPPIPNPMKDRKQNGWVLRPHQTMDDPDKDDAVLYDEFKSGLQWAYRSTKPIIVDVDEGYHVQVDLKLKKFCDQILLRGAPTVALWSLLQRGRMISYNTYNAPEHILIFKDPDVTNVKRYAEMIGGVDPTFVVNAVNGLNTTRVETGGTISEFLYIRRAGPELYIVDTQ